MKKLIDDFNQKLQTLDNEDLLEWNRLEFIPSDPKALATLSAQRVLPQELIDFLEHFGALQSCQFQDAWQTLKIFSAEELQQRQTGVVTFIDAYWGGRPELAECFSAEEIARLNEQYQVFGLRYVDDNVHDYLMFDQHGHFGHLPFDQDDCANALEILKNSLGSSALSLSLTDLVRTQLEMMLTALEQEQQW